MAGQIPFITGDESVKLLNKHYADAKIVHIWLERAKKNMDLPQAAKTWIDPGVDGMEELEKRVKSPLPNSWVDFMRKFKNFERIGTQTFHSKPVMSEVQDFVDGVLDACREFNPDGISVPQIPLVDGAARNKINLSMAKATAAWKRKRSFGGKLILPIIATKKSHLHGRTSRTPKVKQAASCVRESEASGIWVVDTSAQDETGSTSIRTERFQAIIGFHEELNEVVDVEEKICGPYWGLGIVLLARGIVKFTATGLGTGYQHHLSGGQPSTPKIRIALPPLRRRVLLSADLKTWLSSVLQKLQPSTPAYADFHHILTHFRELSSQERAKNQVVEFYRNWFEKIFSHAREGRPMALYQDLSAAYALGKMLPPLPSEESTVRRPEAIAEALMLRCL